MEVRIKDSEINLSTEKIKALIELEVSINAIIDLGRKNVSDRISEQVADILTEKILENHSDIILKKVNIESIVKQIQLKVVSRMTE